MNRFILNKLTVSGSGHKDSIIEFSEGFNLIIGPSNTGKSLVMDCIDYAFGFSPKVNRPSKIVDNNNGYTHVELQLLTNKGLVSFKREIGTTKVAVTSSHPEIDSDTYSSEHNAKKSINSIFMKLIGIEDVHKILSSQKGGTQKLTWRSILHLFFMKQKDIDRETSPLISPSAMGTTSSGAALLYLLTGKDANEFTKPEDPEISIAKRNAIMMYIRDKKDQLSQRREDLANLLAEHNITDIKIIIASINDEINAIQQELNITTEKSKKLMAKIYHQNSKLSESNTVLYNFNSLSKQYQSDVKRLGLIVDGQLASANQIITKHCPFCDSKLKEEPSENYIAATSVELSKLEKHISELSDAQKIANQQKKDIEKHITLLEAEKQQLDDYINIKLHPKLGSFKNELNKNLRIIRWQNELDIISQDEQRYSADLFEKETEEDPNEIIYNIFSSYEYDLVSGYEKELISTLKESNIGGSSTARLNMKSFDIEIDNHTKSTCMGGGYCAILNTLAVYAMNTYIYLKSGYAPGFFAIDSALTQLSEAEYVTAENSVKNNFMNFLLTNALGRQVIMVEQKDEIPFVPIEDETKGIYVIEFSRDPNQGRYGFLNDVVNPEHK